MKTLLSILFALFLLPPLTHSGEPVIITADQAKSHIGETATVKDVVSQVSNEKGAVFLTFGGSYPSYTFAAVAPSLPLSALSAFEGKTVSVSGKIVDYKGKPAIFVSNAAQISQISQ